MLIVVQSLIQSYPNYVCLQVWWRAKHCHANALGLHVLLHVATSTQVLLLKVGWISRAQDMQRWRFPSCFWALSHFEIKRWAEAMFMWICVCVCLKISGRPWCHGINIAILIGLHGDSPMALGVPCVQTDPILVKRFTENWYDGYIATYIARIAIVWILVLPYLCRLFHDSFDVFPRSNLEVISFSILLEQFPLMRMNDQTASQHLQYVSKCTDHGCPEFLSGLWWVSAK